MFTTFIVEYLVPLWLTCIFCCTGEFNFTAVDHATSKVRELVDFLGFKAVTLVYLQYLVSLYAPCMCCTYVQENGLCQEMIIADHEVSRPCLVVFDELSTEELACTTCPNVDDLLHISKRFSSQNWHCKK